MEVIDRDHIRHILKKSSDDMLAEMRIDVQMASRGVLLEESIQVLSPWGIRAALELAVLPTPQNLESLLRVARDGSNGAYECLDILLTRMKPPTCDETPDWLIQPLLEGELPLPIERRLVRWLPVRNELRVALSMRGEGETLRELAPHIDASIFFREAYRVGVRLGLERAEELLRLIKEANITMHPGDLNEALRFVTKKLSAGPPFCRLARLIDDILTRANSLELKMTIGALLEYNHPDLTAVTIRILQMETRRRQGLESPSIRRKRGSR